MKIQLIYFSGCPNANHARAALRQALIAEHLPAIFDEIDTDNAAAPALSRRWPSPTILIDGQEVTDDSNVAGTPGRAVQRLPRGRCKSGVARPTRIGTARRDARTRTTSRRRCITPPSIPAELPRVAWRRPRTGQHNLAGVMGRKNKPTDQRSKKIIYECHLKCHLKESFGFSPSSRMSRSSRRRRASACSRSSVRRANSIRTAG